MLTGPILCVVCTRHLRHVPSHQLNCCSSHPSTSLSGDAFQLFTVMLHAGDAKPDEGDAAQSWSWESYTPPTAPPATSGAAPDGGSRVNAVILDQLDACWAAAPGSEANAAPGTPALHGLSMAFPQGQLSVITGDVGAGS